MNEKKTPQLPKPSNNKKTIKNIGFLLILVIIGAVVYFGYNQPENLAEKPYNDVINRANSGEISKLEIKGEEIKVTLKGQEQPSEKTRLQEGVDLYGAVGGLTNRDVQVAFESASNSKATWTALFVNLLPVLIIGIILVFMLRSAQGQGNQAMGFGKSSARLYGNEKSSVSFADVAGSAEAKQDLAEVVEFLKFPKKFQNVGAKIPKGVLLVGSPGTGKTLLARAVAGEANVPFFSISGSEFVEMFVGVGASRVKENRLKEASRIYGILVNVKVEEVAELVKDKDIEIVDAEKSVQHETPLATNKPKKLTRPNLPQTGGDMQGMIR